MAFSLDLRRRVLADCQGGLTYAAIARKYTVSAEWVRIFYNRFQETGEVAPRSHATKRQPFHVRHEAVLRAAVAEKPDRTLEELRQHLGGDVSIGTLWHALRALKISFKKNTRGGRTTTSGRRRRTGGVSVPATRRLGPRPLRLPQ